jgi:(p)ppGpp synthase/HD superfamily hydrolase
MVFLIDLKRKNNMKKEMPDFKIIEAYAMRCYNEANCNYGGRNYYLHITMVLDNVKKHQMIFKNPQDALYTMGAAHTHDLMEDARQTYNNICDVCGTDIADITLKVTDVDAENRMMKHLLTMGKTVRDPRAIILKMCDILANTTFSKETGSTDGCGYSVTMIIPITDCIGNKLYVSLQEYRQTSVTYTTIRGVPCAPYTVCVNYCRTWIPNCQ